MILRNGLVGSFHHDLYAFDEEHFEGEELELPLNAKEMQLAFLQQDNKSWQMMVDSVYHRTGFMIAGNMNIDWIVVQGVPHKFH